MAEVFFRHVSRSNNTLQVKACFLRRDGVDRRAGSWHHYVIMKNVITRSMTQRRRFKRCTVVCFNKKKIAALKKQLPSEKDLREWAHRCKALGHPARQAILHILRIDECCVCDIAKVLGKPVSTVSQHLRTLSAEGLLDYRQEGKLVFYFLMHDVASEAPSRDAIREGTR